MRHINLSFTLALLLASALATSVRGENWPQFRGPTGLGHSTDADLPITWGEPDGKNVPWKSPLIGDGHASPIVWGDRVFVCTAHWPATVTDRAQAIPEHHVICHSASDGKQLWDSQVPPGPWLRGDFRSGTGGGYAAPTPATDGKLVYVAFGSSVLAALDWDGKLAWRYEIKPFNFDVTLGSSPVLYEDTVIMLCAMSRREDTRLVALDKQSGEIKWEQKLPTTGFAHTTPIIIRVADHPQMIVLASGGGPSDEGLQSFDPASGKRIWWCRTGGEAASPAYGAGILYADSGRGGPGVAVDPTGQGDVFKTHVKWNIDQVPEAIGSPIIVGDYVYRLHTPGVLKCWKAATGEQVYAERLQGITSTWASPVADAAGNLFFASAGKSYVIRSGPEFKVLAMNDLNDANHASPAISAGRLYLVGAKQIYCIGKR